MPIVVKGDGTREEFQVEKLLRSLKHSGADEELSKQIAARIVKMVREGMSTTHIYREAFKILRKDERTSAARYSMRRAILELGPTGFPFEDFIAELMKAEGYETQLRVMVAGRCIEHEVDVVLKKDGRTAGAELKFHNTPGFKTDLKTALYVRARYWDIEWGAQDRGEKTGIDEGWLITNTKFTGNAIDYASCSGIRLIGWSFPHGNSIADMIDRTGVYPVTVLTTLTAADKNRLLKNGVTLCKMVAGNPESLERIGISGKKLQTVVEESSALCKI
ncbi:restriction endonuclease [Patescibacteria group bacterium]|nr:restriction endonuclease [Patescibacteria group bacterium]